MYKAKIFGKEILLSDKDFKQIVRKYDILNAGREEDGNKWTIRITCPLCRRYARKWDCNDVCPFGGFSPENRVGSSCVHLAEKLLNDNISLDESETSMYDVLDAIRVEKIRRILLKKFKKVRK